VKSHLLVLIRVAAALAAVLPAYAQFPLFTQEDLRTLPYEELGDVLRKYPGMYPLDYGTPGAPMLFRPWSLLPWECRAEMDGIPQNRLGDGLYDSNQQPVSELGAMGFDFLNGGAAGMFALSSRTFPVGSQYAELHVRRGYYNYTDGDFTYSRKIVRRLTLEIDGRMAVYSTVNRYAHPWKQENGSWSRRIRSQLGFDAGRTWRGTFTYAASSYQARSSVSPFHPYYERRDGILKLAQQDAQRGSFAPSLSFYLRQDREEWGNPLALREMDRGWILEGHARLPHQRFTFEQSGVVATMDYPGIKQTYELAASLAVRDLISLRWVSGRAFASLRKESYWRQDSPYEASLLPDIGFAGHSRSYHNLYLLGGTEYVEEMVPLAWRYGSFRIGGRPLLIAPEFADLQDRYAGVLPGHLPGLDRYLKSELGLGWQRQAASINVELLRIDRPGRFANHFLVDSDRVYLWNRPQPGGDVKWGISGAASVPLGYGFRLDSWWFAQAKGVRQRRAEDSRGYSRLYYEESFFKCPLVLRSHVSYERLGTRNAFSEHEAVHLHAANLVGLRLSATVRGFSLIWGVDNIFKQRYSILPGYPIVAREEFLGLLWSAWL
jgi:hypothetical protein